MSRVPRPLTIAAAKEQARSVAMAAAEPLSYVVLGERESDTALLRILSPGTIADS